MFSVLRLLVNFYMAMTFGPIEKPTQKLTFCDPASVLFALVPNASQERFAPSSNKCVDADPSLSAGNGFRQRYAVTSACRASSITTVGIVSFG